MLTLTEGSRPTSDTDAAALATSEEEDRLIMDALYFSEPNLKEEHCFEEPVASPTPSNSSTVRAHVHGRVPWCLAPC